MKAKRVFAVLLLVPMVLLLFSCSKPMPREEYTAKLSSLTNMDGSGEVYIHMPYEELSAKLEAAEIPYRSSGGDGVITVGPSNEPPVFQYDFGDFLAKLSHVQGIASSDNLVYIQMPQSKEGLANGDSVEKLKELYPDYEYLKNPGREAEDAPYFLPAHWRAEPQAIGGWFIKEIWKPNGDLIVSAIEASGADLSDIVFNIQIRFIPAAVAQEHDWQ